MPDFAAISRTDLADRRRRLRQQRRWRIIRGIWQLLALGSLAVGLIWLMFQPIWVIQQPSQITIEGNNLIPAQMIQSLLPINYPESLWEIKPQVIVQQLESKAPIAEATVTRQLFPPGLLVQIQERQPVAIAYSTLRNTESNLPPSSLQSAAPQIGLLDERGNWIPLESYTALNQSLQLPSLKVIGMQDRYRTQWAQLYRAITLSPIQISEIDWRDPANLILHTEVGIVHLGPFTAQLSQQLLTLDQMRQLAQKIDPREIAYIDLKNPDSPAVQLFQTRSAIPLNPQ